MDTLFELDTGPPSVVLSYGLGVDSTAILLRWINEPACRDFDLDQLTVVTAMTGDEWEQTRIDVEAHVLPVMREHGIRYIQAARSQRYPTKRGDGIVRLDDSTSPSRLYLEGAYRLSDEMLETGTIPQLGGRRLCTMHAKGDVLDPIIRDITGGRSYRHVVGFEAGEPSRATKDTTYNTPLRTGEYPLIEWGWDREKCQEYIHGLTGIHWQKSACAGCPFALTVAGRPVVMERFRAQPDAAYRPLLMEHIAMALNPEQRLAGKLSLRTIMVRAGLNYLVEDFLGRVSWEPHALYEVRRIYDPSLGVTPPRSVKRLAEGTHREMLDQLATLGHLSVDEGTPRVYLHRRGSTLPTSEHFYVAAPATVIEKQRTKFETWWQQAQTNRKEK